MIRDAESPTWQFGSVHEQRPFFRGLNRGRHVLDAAGVMPQTPVFMTEINEDFGRTPATREVLGWKAAEMIAMNQFRLATAEEVERAKKAQREAEQYCAAIEANNRKEGNLRITSAFAEALKQLGPNLGAAK